MKKLPPNFSTNRRGVLGSILALLGSSFLSFSKPKDYKNDNSNSFGGGSNICNISNDASFEEQLPLSNDEIIRFEIESNLDLSHKINTIPSPDSTSSVNHLGWPVAVKLSTGRIIMVYLRQISHGGGDSVFAGRYVTRSDDLVSWNPPHPWPSMAGRIGPSLGLHAIGKIELPNGIERVIILTSEKEFFYSDDQGESWILETGAFEGMLDGSVEIGPNLINHTDFGLLGVFGQEFGSNTQRRNYIVRTLDGFNWEERVWINSKIARSVEPALATWGAGHMVMIAREFNDSFGNPDNRYYYYTQHVYRHENCSFEEVNFSTARTNIRGNAIIPKAAHDTAEVKFNPVTNRIEVIQSHRLGGGLGNTGNSAWVDSNTYTGYYEVNNTPLSYDENPVCTLNIWSISPNDLLEGSSDWRFDGTLLKVKGYSGNSCRDGFHPGGSIVDSENNKQHIFIFSGVRAGPSSIFRISRTLNTDSWRGVSPPEPLPSDCLMSNNSDINAVSDDFPISMNVYPNPATNYVQIEFEFFEVIKRELSIDIYDVLGNHVQRVLKGYFPIGRHQAVWNLENSNPSSGTYFISMKIAGQSNTNKITVLRN